MTARTNSSRQGRRDAAAAAATRPEADTPVRTSLMVAAVALAAVAGLSRAVGPFLPVVDPYLPPGFSAAPLLAGLALLPVAVAVGLILRGHVDAAGWALVIAAVFAPGQLLTDLQLGTNPSRSSRPDLALPDSLISVDPAAGLWLLLAGHLLVLGAGVLAGVLLRSATGDPAGSGETGGTAAGRQGPIAVALSLGTLAGMALLLSEPFESVNLFQLARAPLEQPLPGFVGGVLLVLAAPAAAALAAGADTVVGRRAGAAACALSLAAVSLPQLLSGVHLPGLAAAWGPPVVLGCAVALLVTGFATGRTRSAERDADVELPGAHRLTLATGLLGVLTGAACVLAGVLGQVELPPRLAAVPSYDDRLLMPAGLLVGVLAAVVLFGVLAPPVARPGETPRPSRIPPAVRPALLVAVAVVPFSGAVALDGALAATDVAEVDVGFGAVLTVLAVLGALGTAILGGLAGSVEREDTDLTDRTEQSPRPVMLVVAALAALAAAGAFALPVLTGPEYAGPALFGEFSLTWWGMATALCAVLAAALLAASARQGRGCALLLGAATVLGIRLLELPLTAARADGATESVGAWFSAAGVIVLLAGAAIAVLGAPNRRRDDGAPSAGARRGGPP